MQDINAMIKVMERIFVFIVENLYLRNEFREFVKIDIVFLDVSHIMKH